jgi:hypothetical protein
MPGIQISISTTLTGLYVANFRKPRGSRKNRAEKPADKSKRSNAFNIEGSSSTTQIVAAAPPKTTEEFAFIFLRSNIGSRLQVSIVNIIVEARGAIRP